MYNALMLLLAVHMAYMEGEHDVMGGGGGCTYFRRYVHSGTV